MNCKRRARCWSILLTSVLASMPAFAESLEDMWEVALNTDHTLRASSEVTAAAGDELGAAKTLQLPSINLSAGYTVLDQTPALVASVGPLNSEFPFLEDQFFAYNATATLPLHTGGQITQSIKAAIAGVNAARAAQDATRLSLKMAIANNYIQVLRAGRFREVAESHVKSLQAHSDDVEHFHSQGMVARNDVLAARVALANARQQALQAENALDIARSALNRRLGRSFDSALALDERFPKAGEADPVNLTGLALRQRPELIATREQAEAMQHKAAAKRGESRPQIGISGGYSRLANRHLVDDGFWSVTVGVTWNVFDGGGIRRQSSAMDRRAHALGERHKDLRTLIALEVRQAWLDLTESRQRVSVTREAIDQSVENLRVSRERYAQGLSTSTEVLDAENLRTQSESNFTNATYDAVLADLRLKRAVGNL